MQNTWRTKIICPQSIGIKIPFHKSIFLHQIFPPCFFHTPSSVLVYNTADLCARVTYPAYSFIHYLFIYSFELFGLHIYVSVCSPVHPIIRHLLFPTYCSHSCYTMVHAIFSINASALYSFVHGPDSSFHTNYITSLHVHLSCTTMHVCLSYTTMHVHLSCTKMHVHCRARQMHVHLSCKTMHVHLFARQCTCICLHDSAREYVLHDNGRAFILHDSARAYVLHDSPHEFSCTTMHVSFVSQNTMHVHLTLTTLTIAPCMASLLQLKKCTF